jgi:hypothetical protein
VPRNVALLTLLPYAKYTREPGGARTTSGGADDDAAEEDEAARAASAGAVAAARTRDGAPGRGAARGAIERATDVIESGGGGLPGAPTSNPVIEEAEKTKPEGRERTQHTRVATVAGSVVLVDEKGPRVASGGCRRFFRFFSRLEVSGFARVDVTRKDPEGAESDPRRARLKSPSVLFFVLARAAFGDRRKCIRAPAAFSDHPHASFARCAAGNATGARAFFETRRR